MLSQWLLSGYQTHWKIEAHWKYLYGCILLISELCGALIPLLYLNSSKSRHHPASLILIICLLEMITCYQFFMDAVNLSDLVIFLNDSIDYQRLIQLYIFDPSFTPTEQQALICRINQNLILLSMIAQLNYYCVLTVDLIITLKKPFINPKSRLKAYHLCAISLTGFIYIFSRESVEDTCESEQSQSYTVQSNIYYQLAILAFLLIICVGVCIQDYHRCRKLSEKIRGNRKSLYINHTILMSTLLIIWAVPLISKLIQSELKNPIVLRIYFAIMLLHPSIFFIIRLRDPYNRVQSLRFLKRLLRRQLDEEQGEDGNNVEQEGMIPLGQLVLNQTNQETVANILNSILMIVDYKAEVKTKRVKRIHQHIGVDHLQTPLLGGGDAITTMLEYDIVEYNPSQFQELKLWFGIDQESFYDSLRLERNIEQIKNTQESLGKSGAFFFFSHDKKLIIKTISSEELELIISITNEYTQHMKKEVSSLLTRLYGIFTINIAGFSSVHLILMENLFQHMPGMLKQYDLKGSLINRKQKVAQSQVEDVMKSLYEYKPSGQVLKDVNFIQSTDIFIELNRHDRNRLFNQLKRDIEFLEKYQIMDYSFLVAIGEKTKVEHFRHFSSKSKTYCFGIIDFTQKFTFRKKMEMIYKSLVRRNGAQISCVDPQYYSRRFYTFLNSVIIINNNV